ncbi:MAG: knotted carbamoyltransferase YgeW [Elusimicrobia bacterium GWC2_51_8]|nr:MAG: knotted carbamoyltransferase YgeW [Elusimicrobia bacterium GWA2_51_34]OGR61787.1 MAG: knotted carbamoyltransferase YgeW [Elusimicrobia bacterium GWC2_51_8]OGR86384.1 MAG: knotted carbamoyltransferase YgeW [Elusimicrobia bacterium GWF2_52_66]HAF96197.1 knotted carbamoyltransferase YgeW [Elusimicrobiota bacterium]HCE97808.1 knotted carbamoyltransferase YgeW [Elusimicrobiota bacterium]
MSVDIAKSLTELEKLGASLYGRDFLLTWEKSDAELKSVFIIAELLKELHAGNIPLDMFRTGLAVSNFRDNSTRTRFSFASACNLLGLAVQDLDEGKSQIAHGETVRETANMISFLTEAVGIRDDMFIGKGHTYMKEVAEALDDGYKNGVLNQRPAVVNLQCDLDHPTQTMADMLFIKNHFGGFEKLKGRKIAMTWAYSPSYGKPLSVPQGVIALMTRYGMNVELAYPEGYDLLPETIKVAGDNAKKSGGSFKVSNSMETAFRDADIVYPKSWAPYRVMERRTQLLEKADTAGLKELEKECLAQNAGHMDWICDEKKMALTKNGEGLYLHCLPADIKDVSCKNGEVAAGVFEKYRIGTYKEAGYKPFVIAAMITACTKKNPAKVIGELFKAGRKRVL